MPDNKNKRPEDKQAQENTGNIDIDKLDTFLDQQLSLKDQLRKPDPSEEFGKQTAGSTSYSDAEIGELKDKGVDMWKAWQDDFKYDKELSEKQGWGEQLGRAAGGGLYKGGLTAIENVGYMSDVEEWLGMADEFDENYSNWASEWAKEQKQNFDESNPIHSSGTGDSGWWYQNLQGLVDSSVGFAVPGGLAGKGMSYGSKLLSMMIKNGAISEALVTQMGTAMATNYAESKMMASELYNNVYNKALTEGISHDRASGVAKEQADEFLLQNKLMMATDFVALRHLTSGKGLTSGAAEKSLKDKSLEYGKDAVAESFEEVYSGFTQKENERDAHQELGLDEDSSDSFFERTYDYITSEEGWREAMLGAAGGPFQAVGAKATKKAADELSKKIGIKQNQEPKNPGEFNKTLREKPEIKLPEDPGPKPIYDKKGIKNTADERNAHDVKVKEWELKKKKYNEAKKQLDDWDKEKELYEKEKAKYERESNEWEQFQKEKNIGKKSQAKEDVKEILKTENKLQKDYTKAVLSNDKARMLDIENQRFEGLFLRYAKRNSTEALEGQLKEIANNPESTQEEKEKATRYLGKMEEMWSEYYKSFDKFGNRGLSDQVFRSKMRTESSKEVLGLINKELSNAKLRLENVVRETEGKSISPLEQEVLTLKVELAELKFKEAKLGQTFSAKMQSDFNRKLKDYEDRIAMLMDEKDLKDNESKHLFIRDEVKSKLLKELTEFKELERLAKERANAWAAYKTFENTHNYLTSENFKSDLRKHNSEYLSQEVENMSATNEIPIVERQIRNLDVSPSKRKELYNRLQEKSELIKKAEEDAVEEHQREIERNNHLKLLHAEAKAEIYNIYNRLKSLDDAVKNNTYNQRIEDDIDEGSEFIRISDKSKLKSLTKNLSNNDSENLNKALLERNRSIGRLNFLKGEVENFENLLGKTSNDASNEFKDYPFSEPKQEQKNIKDTITKIYKEEIKESPSNKEVFNDQILLIKDYTNSYIKTNSINEDLPTKKEKIKPVDSQRDLTEKEINAIQDYLEKNNKTEEDQKKIDKVKELKTIESIKNSNIKEKTIPIDEDLSLPVIKEESNKNNKKVLKEFEWSVAYSSGQSKEDIRTPIAEWIESNSEIDKVGTVMKYVFNPEDLNHPKISADAKSALDKVLKGEKISDREIENIPIQLVAYKDGEPITIGSDKVFGWLRTASYPFQENKDNKKKELLKARKKLVEGYLKGVTYETKISKVGPGVLESKEGVTNDPRKYLDNIKLLMSDGLKGLVDSKFNQDRQVDPDLQHVEASKGFIFVKTRKANGKFFPLKLNSRKLNEEETDVLFQITQHIANGKSPSQPIEGIPQIEGMSYERAINLLVYEGGESMDKKYPFWIDLKSKKIKYNGKEVDFNKVSSSKNDLKDYFRTLWRATDSSLINKKLSDKFTDDFTWFGKKVDINTEYNNFQFDNEALSTNATFPNGKLFRQPYILTEDQKNWNQIGSVANKDAKPSPSSVQRVQVKAQEQEKNFDSPISDSRIKEIEARRKKALTITGDEWEDSIIPVGNTWGVIYNKGEETLEKEFKTKEEAINWLNSKFDEELKEAGFTRPKDFEQASVEKSPLNTDEENENIGRVKVVADKVPSPEEVQKKPKLDFNKFKSNTEKDSGNTFPDDGGILKSSYNGLTEPINIEAEMEELKKILPNVPVRVYNGLLRIRGGLAEGVFYKGVITLSDAGNKGVAYHEAFHAVSQLYLSPEERSNLYDETRKRFGNNLSNKDAEEILAEEFREYMKTRGAAKVPKIFKWLYDLFLDLINVFKTNKRKLFSNIRAGRFDYVPTFRSTEVFLSEKLPFSLEQTRSAVDALTYMIVHNSGILSTDTTTTDVKNLEDLFNKVKNIWADKGKEKADQGKEDVAINFYNVLENWDVFKALVIDELHAYGLVEASNEDVNQDSSDNYSEDEEFNADHYKNEGLNIKPALEFSTKDNATGNTKAVIALLPKIGKDGEFEIDPHFNAVRFANFGNTWRLLENNLAGIVGKGDVTADEMMMDRILQLSENHPELKSLYNKLNSKDFPEFKRTQFFNAFSKQSVLYDNDLVRKTAKNKYEWILMNADSQNQGRVIRDEWVETFKSSYLNGRGISKDGKNQLSNQLEKFNKAYSLIKEMADDKVPFDSKIYLGLKNFLNKIGVGIDEKALRSYILSSKGNSEAMKLLGTMDKLRWALFKTKRSSKTSLQAMLEDGYEWDEELNFLADQAIIRDLASYSAAFSTVPGENSVLGPDGNSYYTKSLNNFVTKTLASWKSDSNGILSMLDKQFHRGSRWLKYLANDRNLERFAAHVYLQNRLDNPGDPGDKFTDLSKPDEIMSRMVRTLEGVKSDKKLGSRFSPLTLADKSTFVQFSGIPMEELNTSFVFNNNKGSLSLSKKAVDIFYDYFIAEYERIAHAINNPGDVSVYDKDLELGKKFYLFPEFNPGTDLAIELGLFDKNGMPIRDPGLAAKVKPYIERSIRKQIFDTKNELLNLGILAIDKEGFKVNGISESIKDYYNNKHKRKDESKDIQSARAAYDMVGDYVMNSMISNIEFMMMFSGDPAYYKDLPKRTPETIATGQDLRILKNIPRKFKVAIVGDLEGVAPNYENYLDALTEKFGKPAAEKILKPYRENNQADAQAYITHERFKNLMRMLGKWEPKHEEAYQRLISGENVNPNDLLKMQSLKGMHYELREDGDRFVPTYLKYSQAVLWPSLVKGTKLENVLKSMEDNKVDELVFKSGIKVGSQGIGDFKSILNGGDGKLKPFELDNFHWKLQQDLPSKYHKKGEALVGSQVKKNIKANLKGKSIIIDGKPVEGSEVIKMVENIESQLSDLGKQELEKEWGIKDGIITDIDKIYSKLENKLKADRASSNILQQVKDRVPFNAIFQFKEKIEQELHAMVTKSTVKLKAPGGAFIQMSNAGFTKLKGVSNEEELSNLVDLNEIIWFNGKKELVGPKMINGEVIPGQVLVPYNIVKDIPNVHKMTSSQLKEVLGDSLSGLVGYRIPNQGTSSIDSLEIAGILPPSAGDQMVTYTEVTGKTGSDFDIDKMYVMMPHIYYDKNSNKVKKVNSSGSSKRSLENRRLEIWDSILRSPDVFPELVRPLDSEWLKDDAYYMALLDRIRKQGWDKAGVDQDQFMNMSKGDRKKFAVGYFKNEKLSNLQFVSPMYQFDLKVKNTAGKNGVGQTANHLTHHVNAQGAGLSFNAKLGIGNKTENNLIDLSGEFSKKGEQITQVISAWLNAYVDNAKDPYISLINNNTYTANTVFMLLRAGIDPEWVNRFMSQPAIRDIADEYFKSKSKISTNDYIKEPFWKIETKNGKVFRKKVKNEKKDYTTLTFEKWGDIKGLSLDLPKLNEISLDRLEEEAINPTPEFQLEMLKSFLNLRFYATKLNDAVRASKADTQGATGGAAENLAARELIRKVREEGFILNFDNLFKDTMLGAYHVNSTEFSDKIFSNLFLSKTKNAEVTMRTINFMIGNDYATDAETSKKVVGALYTYMYSGAPILQATTEEINEIFVGKFSIARKTQYLKNKFKNEDSPYNYLLDALQVRIPTDPNVPSYVGINGSKGKDRTETDRLWMTWEAMLNDNTIIVSTKKYPKLEMKSDNIIKIKSGSKTATSRTFELKSGRYSLPDNTTVEIKGGYAKSIKDIDGEAWAKAEGFSSLNNFSKNAKFQHTKDFIAGKRGLYIYSIDIVKNEDGYKISDYARELVKYSFYSSGFSKNLRSFYDLIPHSYMRGDFGDESFVKYIEELPNKMNSYSAMVGFMDQFFRHNWEDRKLVPEIDLEVVKNISPNLPKTNGFSISSEKPSPEFMIEFNGVSQPRRFLKAYKDKKPYLYQYVGYGRGHYVYEAVQPLGSKSKGNYIYEYQHDNNPKSAINPGVTGIPESIKSDLRDESYHYFVSSEPLKGFDQVEIDENLEEPTIKFQDFPEAVFRVVREKNEEGNMVFKMKVTKPNGNDLTVAEAETFEEVRDLGINRLRNDGVYTFYKSFNNPC